MFKKLVFYVGDKSLELNGQKFPLGEISKDILNYPEGKYKTLNTIAKKAMGYWEKYKKTENIRHLHIANEAYIRLEKLIKQVPIISLLHFDDDTLFKMRNYTTQATLSGNNNLNNSDESSLDIDVEKVNAFLSEYADRTKDIKMTVDELISRDALLGKPDLEDYHNYVMDYHNIINDIVSFIKTIQNVISLHLQKLETLNPENYAAALYHFLNREDSHKLIANPLSGTGDFYDKEPVILKYDSKETEPGSGKYKIYEQYETNIFMTLLKTDFYKALEAGHLIRRCQFCKKYFITKKGYHTKYCSNTVPGRPNITCKQMAYALGNPKELAADDPIFQAHYRCKMRIRQDCTRGRINKDDKQTLLDKADEFVFAATISPEISIETLEDQLSTANLCKECKVERKANSVGKPKKKPTMEVKS